MYINRDIEKKIEKYMKSPEIIAILGPRQSGKSTLLKHICQDKENIITFEDVDVLETFETNVKLFCETYVKNQTQLFIDEAQYSQSLGKNLKFIYDTYKIKIIITGSSASNFYLNGLKYLVGRIFVFYLYPFNFREYLKVKNEKLIPLIGSPNKELQSHLKEFIKYGGYPRVVLSETKEEKEVVLKNIYNTLIQREVTSVATLSDIHKTIKLIKLLALQTGNIMNHADLSQESGMSIHEMKKISSVLEQSFIAKEVKPFFSNKKLEIIKAPKIFFLDTGLRNVILNNFSAEYDGSLLETYVFSELMKYEFEPKYWRSKSKAEVDFIIEKREKVIPIEVKRGRAKPTKSLRSFIERYEPKTKIMIGSAPSTDKEITHIYLTDVGQIRSILKNRN